MPNERHLEDESRWRKLMIDSQQGKQAACEQLLEEIGNAIEAYLRLRFGNLDAIEDCVQESLIAVHQARHTYNPKHSFRPWMFTIVRHRAIDTLRKRSSRIISNVDLEDSYHSSNDLDQINGVIDGVRILKRLKPEHREAIVLTKYAGMTTLEAADAAGVSESAIKSRLRRGLNVLRKQLGSDA